jgi:hypothetical protein
MTSIRKSHKSTNQGLDVRHRDASGEIQRVHSHTPVGILRKTYGVDFARGYRSDTKLSTVLEHSGARSLHDLLINRGDARISDSSRAILDRTTATYRNVLRRLADK